MHDLDFSARCAGKRSRGERDVMELCAGMTRKGRWRLCTIFLKTMNDNLL